MRQTSLIVTCLLTFAFAAAADEEHQANTERTSANDLMQQVASKYASMKTYTSGGEVVSDLTVSDGKNRQQQPMAFSIRMARTGRFLIQWEPTLRDGSTIQSAMWGDINSEDIMVTSLKGGWPVEEDRNASFAIMGALSGGAAQTIPSIFFDIPGQPPINSWLVEPTYEKDESIDGDDCHVISGWYGPLKRVYWVSKESLLIRQHRQVFGDGTDAPEMTDEWIKGLLEATGLPATPDSIAQYRKSFNEIREDRSDLKGIITETHTQITVDAELTADQFEPDAKE